MEKLCQRFSGTSQPRQWRDIAFCLSLLPFNSDNAVKKLLDGGLSPDGVLSKRLLELTLTLVGTTGLPFYQDKLHEETVYKRFGEILTKASFQLVSLAPRVPPC